MLSIILNIITCIIKLWMYSVFARKHQQIHKICTEKKPTSLYSEVPIIRSPMVFVESDLNSEQALLMSVIYIEKCILLLK